jgi:hypothetical protein
LALRGGGGWLIELVVAGELPGALELAITCEDAGFEIVMLSDADGLRLVVIGPVAPLVAEECTDEAVCRAELADEMSDWLPVVGPAEVSRGGLLQPMHSSAAARAEKQAVFTRTPLCLPGKRREDRRRPFYLEDRARGVIHARAEALSPVQDSVMSYCLILR